jgi:hypothetical protein
MQHGEHVLIYDHFIYSRVRLLIRKKILDEGQAQWAELIRQSKLN